MFLDFTCSKNNASKKPWVGQLRLLNTESPYEMIVTALGSSYHIICGSYTHGNFLCVPSLGIASELASLNDTFWNLERLMIHHPNLSKVDAISIITAIKTFSNHISIY